MARQAGVICAAVSTSRPATGTRMATDAKASFGLVFTRSGQYLNVPRDAADRAELVKACQAYDAAGGDAEREFATAQAALAAGKENVTITPGQCKPGKESAAIVQGVIKPAKNGKPAALVVDLGL